MYYTVEGDDREVGRSETRDQKKKNFGAGMPILISPAARQFPLASEREYHPKKKNENKKEGKVSGYWDQYR